VDRDLLKLLACPECGSPHLAAKPIGLKEIIYGTLTCLACSREYPIQNGIPYLLPMRLASALPLKSFLAEELGGRTHQPLQSLTDPDNMEIDRFVWEHHLYQRGKEVIYKSREAADQFSSYSKKGARSLHQFIRNKVGEICGKTMLYVGSGNDRLLSLPLEADGAFMVNLDIVGDCLDDLKEAGARNCVCGDARQPPFREGAFDIVFSKGSIHHSHPISEPLKAMARVTKSGGHIIVAEPRRVFRRVGGSGLGYHTPYESPVSTREVISILRAEGVSQFQIGALTHVPPWTPSPIARLQEVLGKVMPSLFSRFAFEFIVYGVKMK